LSGSAEGALERLSDASGREFPNLLAARARTANGLEQRRAQLVSSDHDDDASVVLMGSWGRSEVTSGSDDDFMVLIDGAERADVQPSTEDVKTVLLHAPGEQGIFSAPVFCDDLVEKIGLDGDHNKNLSRRMLFLLESVPVSSEAVYLTARDRVLRGYLGESIKDFRPPRFLLNDTIRYWRTICVDFAGSRMRS